MTSVATTTTTTKPNTVTYYIVPGIVKSKSFTRCKNMLQNMLEDVVEDNDYIILHSGELFESLETMLCTYSRAFECKFVDSFDNSLIDSIRLSINPNYYHEDKSSCMFTMRVFTKNNSVGTVVNYCKLLSATRIQVSVSKPLHVDNLLLDSPAPIKFEQAKEDPPQLLRRSTRVRRVPARYQ